MRINAALASASLFAVLCAASATCAGDRFETFDYPGAYAQRFDGVDKGGGAARGSGLSYSNSFTAIPDAVPGNPAARGSLGALRSVNDLMSVPRGVDVPGRVIQGPGIVAGDRPPLAIRSAPPVAPSQTVPTITGSAAPIPKTTSIQPKAEVSQPLVLGANPLGKNSGAALTPRGKN